MKKIKIMYWSIKYDDLEWKDQSTYDYSKELLDQIMDICFGKGYSLLMIPDNLVLEVWIDRGRSGNQ